MLLNRNIFSLQIYPSNYETFKQENLTSCVCRYSVETPEHLLLHLCSSEELQNSFPLLQEV